MNWLISIENRSINYKITIYNDGRVYGNKQKEKIFILSNETMNKINNILKPILPFFKMARYINSKDSNYVLRINAKSRKYNDCIKVIDRKFDYISKSIINLILEEYEIKTLGKE